MEHEERNGQAVRQELTRVLSSSGFARNERLSGFLRFVVPTTTAPVKNFNYFYLIGDIEFSVT